MLAAGKMLLLLCSCGLLYVGVHWSLRTACGRRDVRNTQDVHAAVWLSRF